MERQIKHELQLVENSGQVHSSGTAENIGLHELNETRIKVAAPQDEITKHHDITERQMQIKVISQPAATTTHPEITDQGTLSTSQSLVQNPGIIEKQVQVEQLPSGSQTASQSLVQNPGVIDKKVQVELLPSGPETASQSAVKTTGTDSGRGKKSSKRKFVCAQCGKDFKLQGSLYNHRRVHTGNKFRCHQYRCQFKTVSLTMYNEHIHLTI